MAMAAKQKQKIATSMFMITTAFILSHSICTPQILLSNQTPPFRCYQNRPIRPGDQPRTLPPHRSMASRSINIHIPPARPRRTIAVRRRAGRLSTHRGSLVFCCAAQESSTATVPSKPVAMAAAAKEAAPAKPKKAPVKSLPQMMEEDVIPSLKAILEAQEDLSQIELSFQENRLEGSFLKNGVPYYFWAFFPDGDLTGPKGFSLSSHGSAASTVEPFLVDEKKITAKLVVFWVEKRLAAQGIIPVWNEE